MACARALLGRFLAVAAVWAAAVVGAVPARADDPAPASASAVGRLTPDEAAMLARRFPDWERKPAAERERVATNVVRLRLMSDEDRARFFERLRRVEAAGPAVMADLPERLATYGRLRPKEQERAREGGRIERALLGAVRAALSPKTAAAIEGKDAVPAGERMLLTSGIVAHVRQRAAQTFQAGPIPEHVVGTPEDAERILRLRDRIARGEALPPRDRAWIGSMLMRERLRQAASTVPAPTPGLRPDARLAHERALQRALGAAFSEPIAAVAAELEAAAAKGRDGLAEYAKLHAPPPARVPTLVGALQALDRTREFLTDEGRAKVDETQAALLAALKATDDEVARWRAAKAPGERTRLLWEIQQRLRRPRNGATDR
jgi:hypothetical protein